LRDGSVDIDITMSIVFGVSVPAVAEACRKAVSEQVEATTGLPVRAVNVLVTDVVFPEDQAGSAG
ncbi:MAG TPA: Asp23/Gls24 family envelope stress response protein, partial [Thermoleophilia bacterium]